MGVKKRKKKRKKRKKDLMFTTTHQIKEKTVGMTDTDMTVARAQQTRQVQINGYMVNSNCSVICKRSIHHLLLLLLRTDIMALWPTHQMLALPWQVLHAVQPHHSSYLLVINQSDSLPQMTCPTITTLSFKPHHSGPSCLICFCIIH